MHDAYTASLDVSLGNFLLLAWQPWLWGFLSHRICARSPCLELQESTPSRCALGRKWVATGHKNSSHAACWHSQGASPRRPLRHGLVWVFHYGLNYCGLLRTGYSRLWLCFRSILMQFPGHPAYPSEGNQCSVVHAMLSVLTLSPR